MIEREHISAAALGALATFCLSLAGCAGVECVTTAENDPTRAPAEPNVVAEPPPRAAPEAATPPPSVTAPAAVEPTKDREAVVPPVTPPVTPKARAAPPVVVAEASTPPPTGPKVTAPTPPAIAAARVPATVSKAASGPEPVASQPARAPLDLDSLGTRLKQTKAIGMLTKLSLKNQVDDLLAKFRAYHTQRGAATLPELRRSYDLLLLKVLSLLQDSDPPLARDIVQSRAAIWGILADPKKFNEARLMAGATT